MKPEDPSVFAGHAVTTTPLALYTSDFNPNLKYLLGNGDKFHARFMHACNCIPRHVQIATLKGAIFRAIDCCNYDELLTRSFALLAWEFSTLGYPRKFIGSAFGHVMSKYPYLHSRITIILQMLTC